MKRILVVICFILLGIYYLTFYAYKKHYVLNKINLNLVHSEIDDYIFRGIKKILPEKLFYFNPNIFNKKKADISIIFSSKDKKYFDSIISIAKNIGILKDDFKHWRNIEILFDKKKINAKIKLHGSSISPHIYGNSSYTINSKEPIINSRKFKIIDENEMNYQIIFYKILAKNYGLITEDPGTMVLVNDGKSTKPFHFYKNFDSKYIAKEYDLIDPIILKKNAFKTSQNEIWYHSNELDNLPYNLDIKSIKKDYYERFSELNAFKLGFNNYEKNYLGNFLAMLYLFNHPHQILGDNERWIFSKNLNLPLYRNEENFFFNESKKINFDQFLFSKDYNLKKGTTFDKYLKFITNDQIRFFRNKAMFKFVNDEKKILNAYDSVFNSYENVLKTNSDFYFKLKYSHKGNKLVLKNNLEKINSYLKIGETFVLKKENTVEVTSNSYVNLEIKLNDSIYSFQPRKFYLKNNELRSKLIPKKIKLEDELKEILLINKITNDTIDINYKILNVY